MAESGEPEISVEAVEALGARRLAEMLVEHADWDKGLRQTLRLALAAQGSGGRLVRTLSKEIQRIEGDRRFYGYRESHALADELDRVREAIVGDLLPKQPSAAAQLLGRFIRLDANVFERADDSDGVIGDVLKQAVEDFGAAWAAVPDRDRSRLAQEVLAILVTDNYGVHGHIVAAFKSALGPDGLDDLERLIREELDRRRAQGGDSRVWALTHGLQDIADARGDVDAFIAAQRLAGTENHALKAICERLLQAGRPEEALTRIEQAEVPAHRLWESDDLRIRILDRLGRHEQAQAVRWQAFTRGLSKHTLDEYVDRLPDGERGARRKAAVATAQQHREPHAALALLVALDVDAAADFVLARHGELNGDSYTGLRAAAQALGSRHPVAAMLLYRLLADAVLARAQSTHYQYAVRDLVAAEQLLPAVPDWFGQQTQGAYREQVVAVHRQKRAFWDKMKAAGLHWKE